MIDTKSKRAELIGCAIGAAVVNLVANGIMVSKDNILYELERIRFTSDSFPEKAISRDAAEILRKGK